MLFRSKKAQTISLVERGFERLGLSHQAVGFPWCSYMVKFFSPLEYFSWRGTGRLWFLAIFPSPSLGYLFFLLYPSVFIVLRPRIGSTFPRLILVPSAHTQSRRGWL